MIKIMGERRKVVKMGEGTGRLQTEVDSLLLKIAYSDLQKKEKTETF